MNATTDVCRCRRLVGDQLLPGGRPITYATFRPRRPGADAELVAVTAVHRLVRDGCPLPPEHPDPRDWAGTVRKGAR